MSATFTWLSSEMRNETAPYTPKVHPTTKISWGSQEFTIDDEILYGKKVVFQQHYFLLLFTSSYSLSYVKKKHFQTNPSPILEKFCIQHFDHNIHK